mgnify:CR=1 FL=1
MRFSTVALARTSAICLCLSLLAPPAFLTGCKPSAEKIAAREEKINREVDELSSKIQELQTSGKFADALALADKSLKTRRFAAHKERFLTQKVDLLLSDNKDAAAGDLVIAAWRTDPAIARTISGRLYNHYQQQNNGAALLAWCKRLLDLGPTLPSDLRLQVLGWQLTTTFAQKDAAAAQASIDSVAATLRTDEAVPLLQNALGSLIDAGQHAFALTLIQYVGGKNTDIAYRNLTVTLTLRCILAASDWTKFPAAFQTCVSQLPDDQLFKLLRTVFPVLQKGGQRDLVEQSSKQVIFNATDKTNAVNLAARTWVESGVAADKKMLPERLDALLNAKVSPVQVGNLFDRYFYEMVEKPDIIRSLCSIGERILTTCSDEATVNNVKVKVLDGAFITENFDLAVQMLEKGIPGKDKAWHEMSLPKVKAHRAMAQKKPREAVQYFREFMNAWIASKQEEEFDPTTGIAYSREWILGRNAHRIAGILDSIPDKAEATKARAEAKAYFKDALKKAEKDPEALKLLKEETKDMGL